MKRVFATILVILAIFVQVRAQQSFWVLFTDKNNTTFNPEEYFDAKAMSRYKAQNLNLYDISNYPVNSEYIAAVEKVSDELVGVSRWFNAAGIIATAEEMDLIKTFPFVKEILPIETEMFVTEKSIESENFEMSATVLSQVELHNGNLFKDNNITGKGVRIAVFDGGFKGMNTHPAFSHLYKNRQIVKTWNFASKKENVYEGHSHGRMVVSCIAGIKDDSIMMGMAPDAEFLLARTEVAAEKKKEEIWWVSALEWADKNGADIVNSSLGYGKQRYNLKNMDGKTSIVAKAANTAASKGILVCNSMGNEADDKEWRMLITPADADSVLSVGAIYNRNEIAEFSSLGPTADGRMKPNVVAKGHVLAAGSNGNYQNVYGTSFSSPLIAGFAACVKQMNPNFSAMKLKEEIEKSADHYPYFDYEFGYGTPQADYFFDIVEKRISPNIEFVEDSSHVYFITNTLKQDTSMIRHHLYYKITNGDNCVQDYGNLVWIYSKNGAISKKDLQTGQIVEVWIEGNYGKYRVGENASVSAIDSSLLENRLLVVKSDEKPLDIFGKNLYKSYTSSLVLNASFILPAMWNPFGAVASDNQRYSRTFTFSFDNNWRLVKVYGLGFRVGFGSSWYACPELEKAPDLYTSDDLYKSNLKINKFDLEFYQRFFFGNLAKQKFFLDTGIFGEWNVGTHYKTVYRNSTNKTTEIYKKYMFSDINKLDYGVRVRLGITKVCALYGQYRISNILKKDKFSKDLPKWEVGIQIF